MGLLNLKDKLINEEDTKTMAELANEDPVGLVKELVRITNRQMGQKYAMWRRHRRKLRNEWYLNIPNSKRPLYSTNYMRSKLNTVKSYMALELPEPTVLGVENSDDPAARYKQMLLEWVLSGAQGAWRENARRLIHETEVCGMAWIKTVFEPAINNGEGGVQFYVLPPEAVKVDPKAVNPEKARWVIHERRDVSYEEILATTGKRPTGGQSDLADSEDYRPDEQKGTTPGSTFTIWECYLRDYSAVEVEETDPETGEVVKVSKRKYPTWRVITVCDGLKEPIEDRALPYEHGELPLTPNFVDDDPTTLYPMSMMELIEPLQDLADALDEQIYRNIRLIVNRQRKLKTGCGLTRDQVDNYPGRVYEMTDTGALEWDSPPALSADIFTYRQKIEERIDKISGIFEVTQGRTERGVTAYAAIATLQDASTRNIRMRLEILADITSRVARQALSLLKQYRGPQFTLRIAGGEEINVLDEYPEVLVLDDGTQVQAEEAAPEQKQAWRQANGIDVVLADIDERYDIEVSADNALPSSRTQRAKVAMDLFGLEEKENGVLDAEALLEALDWPGRSEVLRRRMERQALAAQEAATMDQAGEVQPVGGQTTMPPMEPPMPM